MPSFPATSCTNCDVIYGHRVILCRECQSNKLSPLSIDGNGTVYASTTIRVAGSDHESQEPFEVCLVDVGEEQSVRVTARIQGATGLTPGDNIEFVEVVDDVFFFSLSKPGAKS